MKLLSSELGRIFLAPLSGVADSPFRRICKRFGADTVYSEMASSEGLSRGCERTREMIQFHDEERPIGVQIFGRDPRRMKEAAVVIEQDMTPDFIDINMACPARKIVSKGAGCALMREPDLAREIAVSVAGSVSLPVTAKLRIGWDDDSINALLMARMLEEVGIAAVTVHGRTWKAGFRGESSWEEIAKVKRSVGIPVILSGDVKDPMDAERAFSETECDAVMVGRGVYGRPWVFRAIHDHFGGAAPRQPSRSEMVATILDHLDLGIARLGERLAVVRFRKHLLWYTKGLPRVVALRPAMSVVTGRQEIQDLLEKVFTGAQQ
jgi:nifR3 family TIM-barrel protein